MEKSTTPTPKPKTKPKPQPQIDVTQQRQSILRQDIPEPYYTRQRDGLADFGRSALKGAHWITTISLVVCTALLLTHMQKGQEAQAEMSKLKKELSSVKNQLNEKPVEKTVEKPVAHSKKVVVFKKVIRPIRIHNSAFLQADRECAKGLNYILVKATGQWSIVCK